MTGPLAPAVRAFNQLPLQRRVLLGGVVLGSLVALLLLARWAAAPDYALLFGNLSATDAGGIVEQIEGEGIAYDLRDGGTSVYVPKEEVYGLRLRLASAGAVPDGPAGYELFDGGTLGMTDFMQRLNVKRALEGELARTIGALKQVQSARVHLVLPERSAFRDQQVSPSASVVLSMGSPLGADQVAGIAALVAGAVEGMTPTDVTVLDAAGRMLTGPEGMGGESGLTSAQLRMRQEIESHLVEAGQSMLDRMLGPGRAVVRVSADLDLSRKESETQEVDPEAQVLISEERQEEVGQGTGATASVRNYDITRRTIREQQEAGGVRRLTVSVLLDEAAPAVDVATPKESGATPFTDAQLGQIESLVKNAVGFDEGRGDRFAVQQIRFNDSAVPFAEEAQAQQRAELISLAARYGVIVLALFLAYRLLRRLADRLQEPAPSPFRIDALASDPLADLPPEPTASAAALGATEPADDDEPATVIESVSDGVYAEKLSDEARLHLADSVDLLSHIAETIDTRPDEAVEVVRAWLREDAEADAALSSQAPRS